MTSQQPALDPAFVREARIGLSVVAVLLSIFLFVAFGKYSGWYRQDPVIFTAVVDSETGVETLQPFSPFAAVAKSDSVPAINQPLSLVTDSQPQTKGPLSVDRTGSFQPVAPQPARLTPHEFVDSTSATNGLPELPSLRPSSVVGNPSPNDFEAESIEPVAFNQPEPDETEFNSQDRTIEPNSSFADFRIELPESNVDEQATSIVSQDGDSFWLIAQRVYGDGRLFNALYEFNRNQVKTFNDVPVGTRISTPSIAELQQKWPQLCPRDSLFTAKNTEAASIYTSLEGDTLFDIARDQLGQASRYMEIMQLNAEKLPRDIGHATPIPAGVQIALPVQR